MLKRKNAGGWVLALVAVTLFGGLILRRLADHETMAPEEPITAGMVMSGNERALARDLSATFENMAAQYLPVVVTIQPHTVAHLESCGLVVSHDGYILTSSQNFQAGDSVRVTLHKGRRLRGSVVGSDPITELALIKIAVEGLPYAKFGDSDRLRLGQLVMAISSVEKAKPLVTTAMINAKGRSKVSLPQMEDFIHTAVAATRANHGGALVNLEGEVIGVCTAMASPKGLGMAVPANLAKRVMHTLIKEGKVTRGDIGATAQDIDQRLAQALQINSTLGALLVEVAASSPAERAGLRRGDVILQFANVPIANANEFDNAVAAQKPDAKVPVVVWREAVKVICEVIPSERQNLASQESFSNLNRRPATNALGVDVQNVSADFARIHQVAGVAIASSAPEEATLQIGDIIQEINHRPIRSVRDFHAATASLAAGEVALLLIRRGEKTFFSGVKVQE